LFDKVYGEGAVASQEEFIAKVEEEIKANLQRESDFRFLVDLKDKLVDKAKFDLPKEFLIRWLVAINEGKVTREQVETEYPMFEKDLKWQLIRDKISKEQELVVDDAALTEFAQTYAREQFAAYGLREIPEEYLVRYAEDMLKKDDERRKIRERLLEDKVVAWVKEAVKLDEKEVSADDFNKL
ncbi:MAG: trigger factor, partial [Tenuifilaceae bacterium]|nr:trigger factor [Tenuifilaceae bacterium]